MQRLIPHFSNSERRQREYLASPLPQDWPAGADAAATDQEEELDQRKAQASKNTATEGSTS